MPNSNPDTWWANKVVAGIAVAIVTEECGASIRIDNMDAFANWIASGASGGEWRFQGDLGFGGKLYVERHKMWVSAYKENEAVPRNRVRIDRANARLAELAQVASTGDRNALGVLDHRIRFGIASIEFSVPRGSKAIVPAGTEITGTFTGGRKLAGRKQTVTVFDSSSGCFDHNPYHPPFDEFGPMIYRRLPDICWVGSGGYWHHVAITDSILEANGWDLPEVKRVH